MVAVLAVVVAVFSLAFGIYKHFSTRKVASLLYEVSQLADYDVPESFLLGLTQALVVLRIDSVGSRMAENVVLRLRTNFPINEHEAKPLHAMIRVDGQDVTADLGEMNPGQSLKLLLYCNGPASEDQLEHIELTHAEGEAINRRSVAFTQVDFGFLGVRFTYDLLTRSTKLIRLGPVSFSADD